MDTPDTLFKFYPIADKSSDRFLDDIKNNNLYISSVTKFNDPFDMGLYILTDAANKISNFTDAEKALLAGREKYFAACFFGNNADSEAKKNLYMWSHYADGHRGIAIEYDTVYLKKSLKKQYSNQKLDLIKIQYGSEYEPKLSEAELRSIAYGNTKPVEEYFSQLLKYKTDNWSHENEYRFVIEDLDHQKDHIKLRLLKNAVRNIYLGLRLKEDETKYRKIIDTIRMAYPNAKIFDAHKVQGKLELEFEEILH